MLAKRFFYVCAGLLCLALVYHLGASSATAQAPGNPVVGIAFHYNGSLFAATSSGHTYYSGDLGATWQLRGNVFNGTTPVQQSTWGSVKTRYR